MPVDLDLGSEPIKAEEIVLPVEEKIIGFHICLTSEQKWSQFIVSTTQRSVTISPGEVGQEKFAMMCSRVKAMMQTTEGQDVIQGAKATLREKPLALKTNVEVVSEDA